MSAFEQKVEAWDKKYQYLLFAAEPYEVIAFKVGWLNESSGAVCLSRFFEVPLVCGNALQGHCLQGGVG